ncbi:DUF1843 domain-containing protein [Paludibacterium paludis]|uniref:DUF1843 domain-containing protein n=1 Tax=Paludibacterium paludis TaxID=1225769 RepID=A0A918P4N5_9NEIS|nr:DUF1843 domain-containing protein [Paludibacterium paludis]GGY19774.1 hypothetical protein GCM10011289_24020 [Paludibacterium paludis]
MPHASTASQPPYGVAIQQAISEGDLPAMKLLLEQSRHYLTLADELRIAVDALEQEIQRLESR